MLCSRLFTIGLFLVGVAITGAARANPPSSLTVLTHDVLLFRRVDDQLEAMVMLIQAAGAESPRRCRGNSCEPIAGSAARGNNDRWCGRRYQCAKQWQTLRQDPGSAL